MDYYLNNSKKNLEEKVDKIVQNPKDSIVDPKLIERTNSDNTEKGNQTDVSYSYLLFRGFITTVSVRN